MRTGSARSCWPPATACCSRRSPRAKRSTSAPARRSPGSTRVRSGRAHATGPPPGPAPRCGTWPSARLTWTVWDASTRTCWPGAWSRRTGSGRGGRTVGCGRPAAPTSPLARSSSTCSRRPSTPSSSRRGRPARRCPVCSTRPAVPEPSSCPQRRRLARHAADGVPPPSRHDGRRWRPCTASTSTRPCSSSPASCCGWTPGARCPPPHAVPDLVPTLVPDLVPALAPGTSWCRWRWPSGTRSATCPGSGPSPTSSSTAARRSASSPWGSSRSESSRRVTSPPASSRPTASTSWWGTRPSPTSWNGSPPATDAAAGPTASRRTPT